MFLLNDVQLPSRIEHIDYNDDVRTKLNILSKDKRLLSFVLYGPAASGKKTLIRCYLNNYYNEKIISKKRLFTLSNTHNIMYSYNKYYYELYPSDYSQDNILLIKEFIKYIENSLYHNVLVIYNISEFINMNNIYILKYIIEKHNNITLILTNNKPINLLYNIRVRALTEYELYKIGLFINLYSKLDINLFDLQEIVMKSNRNLNTLYIILQNKQFYSYYNVDNITKILIKNDINMFHEIITIIKSITIKNIYSLETILKMIGNNIIKHTKISPYKLIHIISNLEYNSIHVKYKYIFIETLIINIYKLLND